MSKEEEKDVDKLSSYLYSIENQEKYEMHRKMAEENKESLFSYISSFYGDHPEKNNQIAYLEKKIYSAFQSGSFVLEWKCQNIQPKFYSTVLYFFSLWLWNETKSSEYAAKLLA